MNHRRDLDTDRVTNYFDKILFLTGLWRPFHESKPIRWLYNIYGVTVIFIFSIVYTFALTVSFIMNLNSPGFTRRMFMTVEELAFAFKVMSIFINNANCQRIRATLNDFELISIAEEHLLQKKINSFRKAMIIYWFMPNISIIAWHLNVLFSGSKTLVFDVWYPGFDWQNNRCDYWIIFMHQCFGLIYTANLNVITDMYYVFAMYVNGIKLEILGNRLSTIQYDGDTMMKLTKNILLINLRNYVQIKDAIEVLKKDLKWAYFAQVLLSSIVICGCTSELAKVSISVEKFY